MTDPLKKMSVSSAFGMRRHPITNKNHFHTGVDLRGYEGIKVYAVDAGRVIVSTYHKSLGNYIVIEHDDFCTVYAHLDKRIVKAGQRVSEGAVIGHVGSTGMSTAPHLHFEVRAGSYGKDKTFWRRDKTGKYDNCVEPLEFLNGRKEAVWKLSYLTWNDKNFSAQETGMVKTIQRGLKIAEDGYMGPHTLATLTRMHADGGHLFSMVIDGVYVIFGSHIIPVQSLGKTSVRNYQNAISGTFSWQNKTASMFCGGGKWSKESSTHDWLKQPETVLYETADGQIDAQRALYASELPDAIVNAIGGLGLHNYDPAAEGFSGQYADVLRRTAHTAIGHDGYGFVGAYFPRHTAQQVRDFMIGALRCRASVMLDGGHYAAINSADTIKNGNQLQNNMIQFVR